MAELAVRDYYAVKSPVFPFNKFRGVDTILGPEMRSTGEVMGVFGSGLNRRENRLLASILDDLFHPRTTSDILGYGAF